jgi:hypothetical protein
MRVRFGGAWIAGSEGVVLLLGPGVIRWPLPLAAVADRARRPGTTRHADLGPTAWAAVR